MGLAVYRNLAALREPLVPVLHEEIHERLPGTYMLCPVEVERRHVPCFPLGSWFAIRRAMENTETRPGSFVCSGLSVLNVIPFN